MRRWFCVGYRRIDFIPKCRACTTNDKMNTSRHPSEQNKNNKSLQIHRLTRYCNDGEKMRYSPSLGYNNRRVYDYIQRVTSCTLNMAATSLACCCRIRLRLAPTTPVMICNVDDNMRALLINRHLWSAICPQRDLFR